MKKMRWAEVAEIERMMLEMENDMIIQEVKELLEKRAKEETAND